MKIELTLLPQAVLERRERGARRRLLLGVPLITGLAVAVIFVLLAQQATQSRRDARETERLLVPLRPAAVRLAQLQAETEDLEARRERIQAVMGRTGAHSALLDDIGRFIPRNAWLQSVVVEGTAVTLTGATTDLSSVALFATTLAGSRVLTAVEMRSIQQVVAGNRLVTQFQVAARLR
ncbi:MAG TPA: PilN domain-containing protein [bacterium]|nr:PilN domain-containing protein [bacterium]